MTVPVEFFFDLSSPWTRIAFHNFREWASLHNVSVTWRPFLVGAVFNAVNDSVYVGRQNPSNPKFRLNYIWLKEWAKLADIGMNFPSSHHPIKSVNAMRFCCALEDDQTRLLNFAEAAFEAYFTHQRNLDDQAELISIANGCGLDGETLAHRAVSDANKQRLRTNTDEAIARGAFGSPTIFVDNKFMYFGNDQLPLVFNRIATQAASRISNND